MKILAKQRLKAYSDDYSYDPIDEAISSYVSSEVLSSSLSRYLKQAIEKYPNKRPMTLYRGLNFLNKEHYNNFLSSISSGKITLESFSSWSTDKRIAEGFAKSRKFNLDLGFVSKDNPYWKAYQISEKKKDPLVGYRGIVLITHIPAYTGLDMTEAGYESESEVVLPKGTYRIQYYDVLSYSDKYKNQNPNDILIKLIKIGNNEQIKAVFEFLSANGCTPSDLSDYVKHYLFIKTVDLSKVKPFTSIETRTYSKAFYGAAEKKRVIYGEAFSDLPNAASLLERYTSTDYSKFKILFKSSLKKLLNQIEDLSNKYPDYPIVINKTTLRLAEDFGISKDAYNMMNSYYRPRYDEIQDKGRQVNQIKNYREKQQFIEKYMDELSIFIESILSN